MSSKPLTGITILPPDREEGPYWVKLAPIEAWEIMQWDAANECWWAFSVETPLLPQTYPNLVIGPRIEAPEDEVPYDGPPMTLAEAQAKQNQMWRDFLDWSGKQPK